jgi:BirA family biotin operon repressor/biotin-[acetyl-CoA-carboxylase] ligase
MLTESIVESVAAAAGMSGETRFVTVTGSTNQDLVRMAEAGAPAWSLVVAGHQEAGRGRLGRTWTASPGSSLLASLLVRPAIPPEDAPLVSLGAGACIAIAASVACGVEAGCKWPNDVMAEDRKLGGVLVEGKVEGSRLLYAVVGVGVNVRQGLADFPADLREAATSVAMEGGLPDEAALLSEFLIRMKRICSSEDRGFRATVLSAYRGLCQTIGQTVSAATSDGGRVIGRATGIGDRGELLVRTENGEVRIGFGEVEHLRAAGPA